MIAIDTHIWFWWVQNSPKLTPAMRRIIEEAIPSGLALSVISISEVSQAALVGRMEIAMPTLEWLERALGYPGIRLVPIDAQIAADAYTMPEPFHRDPADRLIVAIARVLNVPLLTADDKILAYPHVRLIV